MNALLQATLRDEHAGAVFISMVVVVICPLVLLLALAPGARGFKVVAATLLLVAAVCGFFMRNYGVVIDPSMIRNLVETEVREASPLLTTSFFLHVLLFGALPALAVTWLRSGGRAGGAASRCAPGWRCCAR